MHDYPSHHPPHIYLDHTWYMVSAATFQRHHLLAVPGAKELVYEHLQDYSTKFKVSIKAWVILDDHYHILLKTSSGAALSVFFRQWHGRVAFELNRKVQQPGRQVWHNYWDTCIRSEVGLWQRLNYIHHNPVKHGYVKRAEDWPYSSYSSLLAKEGGEWMNELRQRYPVTDRMELDEGLTQD